MQARMRVVFTLYKPGELSDEAWLGAKILESFVINTHVVDGHQHQTARSALHT